MAEVSIPSLAGLAGLDLAYANVSHNNIGANATVVTYTVPARRLAWVSQWGIAYQGGTAPTRIDLLIRDAASVTQAFLLFQQAPVQLQIYPVQNSPWAGPGYELAARTAGGDATTDIYVGLAVVLFDWVAP